MDNEIWKRLSRDPEYVLPNLGAIARGERPIDTRAAKPPKEYISRKHPHFDEIMIARCDDIASGRIVIV